MRHLPCKTFYEGIAPCVTAFMQPLPAHLLTVILAGGAGLGQHLFKMWCAEQHV